MTWRGREPRLSVAKRFCHENVTPLGVFCDASFEALEIVVNTRETRASISETLLSVTFQCNVGLAKLFSRGTPTPRAKVPLLEKRCSGLGRERRFRSVDRRMRIER